MTHVVGGQPPGAGDAVGRSGHPPAVDDGGPALVATPGPPGQHGHPGEHVNLRLHAPDDPASQPLSGRQSPTSWNNRESMKLNIVVQFWKHY